MVEAGFYSDVVECLPLDPAAQVRVPPQAAGIFLHPVTSICVLKALPGKLDIKKHSPSILPE